MNALLLAITAALNAYAAYVSYQREKEIDEIEDEIDGDILGEKLPALTTVKSPLTMKVAIEFAPLVVMAFPVPVTVQVP